MTLKLLQLLCFGFGGVLVAIVTNVLLLHFARSLGIRNKNDIVVRWSSESKPSLGGVSFFVVFIFASIAYSIVFDEVNIFQNRKYVGLLLAGSISFVMGLADDAYNTKPLIKLFVQILCGFIFVWSGSYIQVFDGFIPNMILTVLWVVIVMNSLNMLDNMDGITGTTVFFILTSCLFAGWIIFDMNTNIWTLLLIAVIGAILGFLTMNINPSKLFMGDAGSQFIGCFVAYFGIEYLWNSGIHLKQSPILGVFVVLVAFTPAAVDTLTVVINRLRRGQSPMVGGKDHTTHHLVYAGLTDRKVWYVFVIIGLFAAIMSIFMIDLMKLNVVAPIVFFTLYTVFVFVLLYRNTLKYPAPKK